MSTAQVVLRGVRVGAIALPVAAGVLCAAGEVVYFKLVAQCSGDASAVPFFDVVWRLLAPLPLAAFLAVGWRRPAGFADIWRGIVILTAGFYVFVSALSLSSPPPAMSCAEPDLDDFAFGIQALFIIPGVLATVVSALIAACTLLPFTRKNHERR